MSLSSRIIILLTVTTALAAAVAYAWLYVKQSHVEAYLRQRTLVQQAEELSRFISTSPDGSVDLDVPSKLMEAYNSPTSGYGYAIRDAAGRILATSERRVGALPKFTPVRDRQAYGYTADRESMFGGAVRTRVGQREFYTQVEQTVPTTQSLNAAVFNEFFADGGWLGIPFLVALLGISAFTVRTALRPLRELAALSARIDPGSSTLRLPATGVPAEILPLVSSFNNVLDRLDAGLRLQREFNASAAHQLRTPLAVLAANIDLMTDEVAAAKLRYDVALMGRIVNQLLLVARLETLNIPLDERVDLGSTARQAAENLGPIAISRHSTLEVDEPEAPVIIRGNAFALSVAVTNLIENALNHSPNGKAVRIRVTSDNAVEVYDSGPGIPLELRDKIFERFWRGETSKGAGLGLSIIQRIMAALGGTVSVSDNSEGGAKFTLQFPSLE